MLSEAAGRGQHFQVRGHSFSLYRPTLSQQITCNWVYKTLWLNWFKCRLQTIVKNLAHERASKLIHYTKEDVLKNRFILNCFLLFASNSPVKFSKRVFPIVKFHAKFDWNCTTNTISIMPSRCVSLEIRPFYRKLSSRKRGNSSSVFYKIPLKYSNYQRLNSTTFHFLCGERKTQNYAPLQRRATNNHTNSQSYKILNWIYLQWPSLLFKSEQS